MDGLIDDWYDKALASGQGFKSDQERQEYLTSLGDPEKHPMFATSAEDLEGNPLVDALIALKEEDKSSKELAVMYKDEGNEWTRKASSGVVDPESRQSGAKKAYDKGKCLHDAYDCYSTALGHVDAAIAEKGTNSNDVNIAAETNELCTLKSQILSNRAQNSLSLANYGSCVRDCEQAIAVWPLNLKAHFRRCKALALLRKHGECLDACEEATRALGSSSDASMAEIYAMKAKSVAELLKIEKKRKAAEATAKAEARSYSDAWNICRSKKVRLGAFPSLSDCTQGIAYRLVVETLRRSGQRHTVPFIDEEGCASWPLAVLYPEHGLVDFVQGTSADTLLVQLLAEMFPEPDSEGRPAPPVWDRSGLYRVSNLCVYVEKEDGLVRDLLGVASMEQWVAECCRHAKMLNVTFDGGTLGEEDDPALVFGSSRERARAKQSLDSSSRSRYAEVPLGCSVLQALQLSELLEGGLAKLLVFAKNDAHSAFLASNSIFRFASK